MKPVMNCVHSGERPSKGGDLRLKELFVYIIGRQRRLLLQINVDNGSDNTAYLSHTYEHIVVVFSCYRNFVISPRRAVTPVRYGMADV